MSLWRVVVEHPDDPGSTRHVVLVLSHTERAAKIAANRAVLGKHAVNWPAHTTTAEMVDPYKAAVVSVVEAMAEQWGEARRWA